MRIPVMAVPSVFATALCLAIPGGQAWAGWTIEVANPFVKKEKPGKSGASKTPAVIRQVGNGTKKLVQGTADLVTLKWLRPKEQAPASGPPRLYERSRESSAKPKRGLWPFGPLFGPKKPEPPRSLDEWMAQRRPEI